MNSLDYKNELKENLEKIIDDADNMYWIMKEEIEKEVFMIKEIKEEISKETDEVYESLTYELTEKLIRERLPLKVRLFNKITCVGTRISSTSSIMTYFIFNDNSNHTFQYEFSINQIKRSKVWNRRK